jgi:predicted permease
MDTLRELQLAVRSLGRKPGFTTVAILTCALAVGACTAIYSVVYGVLLQPLPYPNAGAIVQVWQVTRTGGQNQFSDPNFEDLRDQSKAFAAFAQFADGVTTVVPASAPPERTRVASVSAQFFDVFGTPPVRGRLFEASERHEGARPVAVVSTGFWQRALASAADPATTTVRINNRAYTVVGVMPRVFDFPVGTDIWVPREQDARNPYRTGHNWLAVGRVSPQLTLDAARADASAVARRLKTTHGDETSMVDAALVPLKEQMTGSVARSLFVLLAAVGCLLAIACANLMNLLLVHVSGRRRELAIRSALGASRSGLARPLVAEVLIITGAGGAIGLGLASFAPRALAAFGPANLPRAGEIAMSWPVVAFTIGTTLLVALGLSLTASWRAGRKDVVDDLRQAQRGQAGSRIASRLRNGLVVAELAASLVLLVGAGLLGRSFALLLSQDPGFRTDGVVTVDLSDTTGGGVSARPLRAQLHERVLDRLGALPGVVAAGGINRLPMGTSYANGTFLTGPGLEGITDFEALNQIQRDPARRGSAEYRVASARYFEAMGIPLVRGRVFDERDTAGAPHVAVISQSLANTRWPNQDPIGARIQFGNMDGDLRLFTVIGVVADITERGLDAKPRPTFYADYRQRPGHTSSFSITLRMSAMPAGLAGTIRTIVQEIDPAQAPRIRSIDQLIAASVSDRRFTAMVTGAFAASALLLAIVGIYGVLSYAVSQRMPEFGIRLALGAQRAQVWGMVLRQAGVLVLAGAAIGLVVARLSTTAMQSLLFGIAPTDYATFGVVTALLGTTALVACAWPAFRATRADPVTVLRRD